MTWKIAVVNSGGVIQSQVELFAAAADEWLNASLVPAWPRFAGGRVRAVPLGDEPENDEVPLTLVTTVTEPNALAFHSKTLWGYPVGTVELPQCTAYGIPWTVPASHEIAEIFGDPELDMRVATPDGKVWPVEICDYCTSDQMPGPSGSGVMLANAMTPAFFDHAAPSGSRFDLMGNVHQSLAQGGIPKGGWAQWQEPDGTYQSAYGDEVTPEMRAYIEAKRGRAWRLSKLLSR